MSGSYVDYVKYSVTTNIFKLFFKKLSNHLLFERKYLEKEKQVNYKSRNLEEILLNHKVILSSAN